MWRDATASAVVAARLAPASPALVELRFEVQADEGHRRGVEEKTQKQAEAQIHCACSQTIRAFDVIGMRLFAALTHLLLLLLLLQVVASQQ